MDQQYSMILGRPLGISGIGDCPPPEPLTTDPSVLRLGGFVDQLTILGRQILGSNQLMDTKIDNFTDKLIALWDTMPDALQFSRSWADPKTQIPEWPLNAMAASALAVSRISEGLLRLRDHIENKPVLLAVPSGQQQERSSSFDWTSDSGPQQQQQQQQRSPRYSESVMGATGMFLLEDHGLQAKQEQTFPPPLSDVPPFIAAVSVAVMPAAAAASNMAVSQSAPQSRTQSLAHPSQHTGGIPLHYRGHQQHPQQQQQQQQGRSASMFIAPCPPAFDPMDPRRDSVYGPIMQTQQQQQAQQQFFRLGHSPRPQQQQQQQPHQQQQQQQHAEDWQGLNSRLLNPSRGIPQLQQQQQQLQLQKRRKASHQERRDG
ncbi:hypothetical protein MBLNU459_g0849t1 [Dothideomycetes sp. NU459]